jgi:hypothetical protein
MQLRFILPVLWIFGTVTLHAEDPASFEVGSLKFQRPQSWEWVPVSSPMRKAQLKVQNPEKSLSADVVFFHFGPGQGGGIQANAQRWMSQFDAAEGAGKVETREVGGVKITLVTTQGTYRSGIPGGPTSSLENYALLGAIIESSGGDVFVKMTGPKDLVQSQKETFLGFVSSTSGGKP